MLIRSVLNAFLPGPEDSRFYKELALTNSALRVYCIWEKHSPGVFITDPGYWVS